MITIVAILHRISLMKLSFSIFLLIEKQVPLLLLYEFRTYTDASEMVMNICDAMDPSTVSYDAAKVCFSKSINEDFDLENQWRSGRPLAVDAQCHLNVVQKDPQCNTD
ncbi:unnamed protein product [Heligmosomoides polygyrus]|uniref:Odorant binding protein n=1 Tax=Heligmosomoides polygyrus TaxID=6339 RepID=A0A183FSA1_HELPZ|nr:unnamed protein product [Heligmosomoides polygyrus]